MVVENLQVKPLMEWLLGSGWYNGLMWQPLGISLLVILVAGGGLALLFGLRRGSPASPGLAMGLGSLFGVLSLLVLAGVVMCATPDTRDTLQNYIASPLVKVLAPLLGSEKLLPPSDHREDRASPPTTPPSESEKQVTLYWTSGALYTWIAVVTGLTGVIYFCYWLAAILVGGPLQGTQQCGRAVIGIAADLARISPRRVYALAWLAIRESIRRRVVVVFVVFVVLILFAALFIKKDSLHPGQLYIQVVLNFTVYLSMLFALVLSALSLPADIRDRTLHTVVTKPVRKIEIVLGRVLGFVFVGTVLLALIGVISYGFTVRSLNHTHRLTPDMLHAESLPGNHGTLLRGTTSVAHEHAHEVTIDPNGQATVDMQKDHTHDLYVTGSGDTAVYTLGPPIGQLQARVPIYAKTLTFLDKTGARKEKGINVGDEWTYRSFIEGGSAAAAIWTFEGISADRFPESKFPNGIPVEMTLEVFRTHKGNQEQGVTGTITLGNPETGRRVYLHNFKAKKFATDVQMIPREFYTPGPNGEAVKVDLFRDMVSSDGRLQIIIQCVDGQQYYGMAQADLYIRAADSSFAWNFFKGYLGIWLQMALVIGLGVTFSTFLSGPVTLLATIFVIITGLFSSYVGEIAGGKMVGGGPFESAERMMTQDNMVSELEPGMKTNVIRTMDQATAVMMRYFSAVVPDVADSDFVDRVAYGFNVGPDLLTRCLLYEAAYLLPVILLGFIFLKQREVAQ